MRFLHDPLTSYVVDGGFELGLINPISYVSATCFPYETYDSLGLDLFGMADGSAEVSYQQIETTYLNFASSLSSKAKAYMKDELVGATRAYIGFVSDNAASSLSAIAIGMLPKIPRNELSVFARAAEGISSFSERHEGELLRLRMTNDIFRGMQNPEDVFHQTNIDRLTNLCFSSDYDLYTAVAQSIFDSNASPNEVLKYEKSLENTPSEVIRRRFSGKKNQLSSLRRAQKRVKKAIIRASNLFKMIPDGSNMLNAFLGDQEIFVQGKIFNYGFKKTQSLTRDASTSGHVPYRFSVYDRQTNALMSELCVGFRNQPTLDQLFSMIVHIHAGKSTEQRILSAANTLNVQKAAHDNAIFTKYFFKDEATSRAETRSALEKRFSKGKLEIEYDNLRDVIKWITKGQILSSLPNVVDNTLFGREIQQLRENHLRKAPRIETISSINPNLISLAGGKQLLDQIKI